VESREHVIEPVSDPAHQVAAGALVALVTPRDGTPETSRPAREG
jgi:hypothetical protein